MYFLILRVWAAISLYQIYTPRKSQLVCLSHPSCFVIQARNSHQMSSPKYERKNLSEIIQAVVKDEYARTIWFMY